MAHTSGRAWNERWPFQHKAVTSQVSLHFLPDDDEAAAAALRAHAQRGRTAMSQDQWGKEALHRLTSEQGFTVHDHFGDAPSSGYMVSTDKTREQVIPLHSVTAQDIASYRAQHAEALKHPNNYLGAWVEGDNAFLDVSTHVPELHQAMTLAKTHDQLGVFDLDNFDTIYTKDYWDQHGKAAVLLTPYIYQNPDDPTDVEGISVKDKSRLGECYVLSGHKVMDDGDGTLVNGSIQGGGGNNPRIGHGWVEQKDGKIWEPGSDTAYSPQAFKELFNPIVDYRYSADEAVRRMATSGHFGPWEDKSVAKAAVRADDVYGSHDIDRLFPEGAVSTQSPWPRMSRTQDNPIGYDREVLHQALSDPERADHRAQFDPRTLLSSQPGIGRQGVSYYLGDEYAKKGETFRDQEQVGNQIPVVYVNGKGDNIILSGHHRAAAALLKGEPLTALRVEEPSAKVGVRHAEYQPGRDSGWAGGISHQGREGRGRSRSDREGISCRLSSGVIRSRVGGNDPAWSGRTNSGASVALRQDGTVRLAAQAPLSWDELDTHLKDVFSPQQLDARKEKHPRSGYMLDVGESRRLDHVAKDVPDDLVGIPARMKVVDHGPIDGSHTQWGMGGQFVRNEPLQSVYRGMSMDEYNQAKQRGYIQSDKRGVISQDEGTNAAVDPNSAISYLPPGQHGMVVKIKAKPEHDWRMIRADGYVRSQNRIPMSDVEVAAPFSKTDETRIYAGHVPDALLRDGRKTAGAKGDLPEIQWSVMPRGSGPVQRLSWPDIKSIMANVDGQYVGHIFWNTDTGEVEDLWVNRDWQRRGIATALWERAKSQDPNIQHSPHQTPAGRSWAQHVGVMADDGWRPTAGMFSPGKPMLDPRVFELDEKMRPEVREAVLKALDDFWTPLYGPEWKTWARVYLAGSAASFWWNSDYDFDTLIGINLDVLRAARPQNIEVSDADILAHLNHQLKNDLDPTTAAMVFAPGEKPFAVTFFCNPGSWDIRNIKPYAAYSLTDNAWVVHPPNLPADWGPKYFSADTWRRIEMVERECQEVLALPEPARTQAGVALFEQLHGWRQLAYSEFGHGWLDFGNVLWQTLGLSPDRLLPRLYQLKHPTLAAEARRMFSTRRLEVRRDDQGRELCGKKVQGFPCKFLLGHTQGHDVDWSSAYVPGRGWVQPNSPYYPDEMKDEASLHTAGKYVVDVDFAPRRREGDPIPGGLDLTRTQTHRVSVEASSDDEACLVAAQLVSATHDRGDNVVVETHLIDWPDIAKLANGAPTTPWYGPAVRVYDGTDIDRLATHEIVDGHAVCNPALKALFGADYTGDGITCKKCIRRQKSASLSSEDRVSVAEQVMENSGLTGRKWLVPAMRYDNPDRPKAHKPVNDFVNGVLRDHGVAGSQIEVKPNHWDLRSGGQASTDGMNYIGIAGEETNDMTLLHELAHIITRSQHSDGHGPEFVKAAHNLYGKYINPEAADVFRGIASDEAHLGSLETTDYEGRAGDWDHITRNEYGTIPTSAIADTPGARGEVPGEHRNRIGADWESFKADVKANGIQDPIFITVDPGGKPQISEGNHRRDAAVELGLPEVPVHIRYFGHSERDNDGWHKTSVYEGSEGQRVLVTDKSIKVKSQPGTIVRVNEGRGSTYFMVLLDGEDEPLAFDRENLQVLGANVPKFKCNNCGAKFVTRERAEQHVKDKHINVPDGLVERRKARSTGTQVGLYDGEAARMDTDAGRWQTVCEDHGSICSHLDKGTARSFMAAPEQWCEDCMDKYYGHEGSLVRTAYDNTMVARGLVITEYPESLAKKIENNTVTARDLLRYLDDGHGVGIWWGVMGDYGNLEDFEDHAYGSGGSESLKALIEEGRVGKDYIAGEVGVVLIAKRPTRNGDPWDPEKHNPIDSLMGNSYLNEGEELQLIEIRYDAGWGWKSLSAQGITTKAADSGRFKGVSVKEDDDGYYVHTHRARSNSYPSEDDIPDSVIKRIEATGMKVAVQDWVDTAQQQAILRQHETARKIRRMYPHGARIMVLISGEQGTVYRHVPGSNAQGGSLTIDFDNGRRGHGISPSQVERAKVS